MPALRGWLFSSAFFLVRAAAAAGQNPVMPAEEQFLPPRLASEQPSETARADVSSDARVVAASAVASDAFGFDLYRRVAADAGPSGNVVFSPASVSVALAMTSAGAAGETERQIASVLHADELTPEARHAGFGGLAASLDSSGAGYRLRSANRLFAQSGFAFRQEFLTLTRDRYAAEAAPVDFLRDPEAARREINIWAARQTESKIPQLIPSGVINVDTRLVLANAVHFRGSWRKPFDPKRTEPAPFRLPGGEEVEVPTMRLAGTRLRYAEADGAKLLRLLYDDASKRGGELSMLLVLPDELDGLADLERKLSPERVSDWEAGLKDYSVSVSLPKFRVRSPSRLAGPLTALGMPLAFDRRRADFSAATDAGRLFLRDVVHEAYVDVDEKGTEAAAATGAVMELASLPEPAEFAADRPFLFLIRDRRTGATLFLGRVADPRG